MQLAIAKLSLHHPELRDISKLRGFIGKKYSMEDETHNHKDSGYLYRYPTVQYKVLHGAPCILGIMSGANLVRKIASSLDQVDLQGQKIDLQSMDLSMTAEEYGIAKGPVRYRFHLPWMAFNAQNYEEFQQAESEDHRIALLNRILKGNLLSMSKGLGYTISEPLNTKVSLRQSSVEYKNTGMTGFEGEFEVNFLIPEGMGIGKAVSKGFGTLERV